MGLLSVHKPGLIESCSIMCDLGLSSIVPIEKHRKTIFESINQDKKHDNWINNHQRTIPFLQEIDGCLGAQRKSPAFRSFSTSLARDTAAVPEAGKLGGGCGLAIFFVILMVEASRGWIYMVFMPIYIICWKLIPKNRGTRINQYQSRSQRLWDLWCWGDETMMLVTIDYLHLSYHHHDVPLHLSRQANMIPVAARGIWSG